MMATCHATHTMKQISTSRQQCCNCVQLVQLQPIYLRQMSRHDVVHCSMLVKSQDWLWNPKKDGDTKMHTKCRPQFQPFLTIDVNMEINGLVILNPCKQSHYNRKQNLSPNISLARRQNQTLQYFSRNISKRIT